MKNSTYLPHRRAHSRYTERLDVFAASPQSELTDDLLRPLANSTEAASALNEYMDKLDKAFDVSDVDAVSPFWPLSSDEKLEDLGLKVVSYSPDQIKSLLTAPQTVAKDNSQDVFEHVFTELSIADLEALLENAEMEEGALQQLLDQMGALALQDPPLFVGDGIEENPDNQIHFNRADVIARVLKAREKDPSVTIVRGPSTPQ